MEDSPNPEVEEFANALKEWAGQGPDREQKQRLLKWLLSRCESRMFVGPGKSSSSKDPKEDKLVVKRMKIGDIEIDKAVMRAMAGYNPSLPTSGWIRGGPIWPKGYGGIWPKGYGS